MSGQRPPQQKPPVPPAKKPFTTMQPPASFKPDQAHYDTNLGIARVGEDKQKLRRLVYPSAWAAKTGIANCPIEMVPVLNLAHYGWTDSLIRQLSNGEQVHLVSTTVAPEAILLNRIRNQLWNDDVDIADFLDQYWKNQDGAIPDRIKATNAYYQPLVDEACKSISKQYAQFYEDKDAKIKELQNQLDKFKDAASSTKPESSPHKDTPKKVIPITPTKQIDTPSKKRKLTGESAFEPDMSKRYLKTSAPKSTTPQAVTAWVNSIKKSIPTNQAALLDEHLEHVTAAFWQIKDVKKRPCLQDLASEWGLPAAMATDMSKPNLLKAIAVASWMAA